ncbi:hypothetical protein B0H12DRAFT_1326622 [Mycena haematopus]|nr:hypothetical protein B0H12DRAFT_1326622 [Mycena haematopus]
MMRVLAALAIARSAHAAATVASSFAGSTSTAVFPPPGVTITSNATFFPDATQVNVFGPTPTGDEAFAIETAPIVPDYANVFPLIAPATSDHKKFDVIHSWGNLSPGTDISPRPPIRAASLPRYLLTPPRPTARSPRPTARLPRRRFPSPRHCR